MEQKNPGLKFIIFAVLFGFALSTDISSFINSKLFNDSVVETGTIKMSSPKMLLPAAYIGEHKSVVVNDSGINKVRNKFTRINRDDDLKPNYPKPTIKLLIFKEHTDKQLQKLPVSITFA